MRTIKFKAKRINNGDWVVVFLALRDNRAYILPEGDVGQPLSFFEKVDPATVCQFTGFLDKNGKEIYEGDVLRSDTYPFSCVEDNSYDNYYGIVGWSKKTAVFYIETVVNPKASVGGISHGNCDYISQNLLSGFEVIGSVHDKEWKENLDIQED